MTRALTLGKMFTLAFMICWGAHTSAAWGAALKTAPVRTAPNAYVAPSVPLQNISTLDNPALSGGISLFPPALGAAAPAAAPSANARTFSAALPAAPAAAGRVTQLALPVAQVLPAAAAPAPLHNPGDAARPSGLRHVGAAAQDAPKPQAGVAASARQFAAQVQKPGARSGLAALFGRFYDGRLKNADAGGPDPVPGQTGPAARGPLNEISFRALKDGSDIRTYLPRTLVISDAYISGARPETVARLQTLIDEGTHLVVITRRGDQEIDDLLVSKLKSSKGNPITVASHGGARISFVENGDWKNAGDKGAFEAREVEALSDAAARVREAAGLSRVPTYTAGPDASAPLSVMFHLEGPDRGGDVARKRKAFIQRFNRAMKTARLPYKMIEHPSDETRSIVQAVSPRLALGRLDKALSDRFAGENLSAAGGETVVLLDARESESLMRTITADPDSVPGVFRGASVLNAADAGEQARVIGALTEADALPPVDVSISDLRQYIDFWRPVVGRSGKTPRQGEQTSSGRYGLYTWQVLHGLLTDLYVDAARSGTQYTNLKKFLDALRARWHGKSDDAGFERYRKSKSGKTADAAYLGHAIRFAGNFWQREIGSYRMAQNEIRQNLMTEGKVYTQVPLRSPFTGRTYALGVSVDRVMKLDTANGRELNATVYRFGKQSAQEGDRAQARAVALAVLRGYGRKGLDLKWHQGSNQGPEISRISVQVEHLNRHYTYDFTPEQLLQIEADGTVTQGPEALALINDIEAAEADQKNVAARGKRKKRTASKRWDGDEWTQKGGALRELFRQYFPDAPASTRLRPFISEAAALRPKPAAEVDPIEVLNADIKWPAGELPAPIDEEGSQIEEDIEARPRVVFVQDIFRGPASVEVVDRIQRLVDAGAHVVFMTARPHKGPDSADEVLLSRLKVSRANPIMVVSYNGGRIALHSRAKNPKPYIPDSRAFPASAIKTFDESAQKLAEEFGVDFEVEAVPGKGSPFQYNLWLPASVPAAELASLRSRLSKRFNKLVGAEGLEYWIEPHPENPRLLWVRSQPLRLSLDRVFSALDRRFKGEGLLDRPERFLIIGDSKRSLTFSKSWPKQATFRSAQDDADLSYHLGGVLGNRKTDTVGVKLGEIRAYDEFWEPMLERRKGNFGDEAAQSHRLSEEDRRYHGPMAMFTGSILYRLMPELFEAVWRGQDRTTTKAQGEERLRQMWRNPEREGVFVSKRQAAVMNEDGWRSRSRGYLDRAVAFFSEVYDRAFGDYAEAAKDIMHNMAGLTTDRQSLVTLVFKAGGKLYKVFTRLPRLMKHDTDNGRVLSVVAYRTGKEPFESDGDGVYAKTLAMTMLVGFAQPGPDQQWHDGWPYGPKIDKLHVRLEYKQGARDLYFDPNDFFRIQANGRYRQGVAVQEIANMIERMRADDEFQAHFKAEQEAATEEEIKAAKKRKKPDASAAGEGK